MDFSGGFTQIRLHLEEMNGPISCFLCNGPHRIADCPQKRALNALTSMSDLLSLSKIKARVGDAQYIYLFWVFFFPPYCSYVFQSLTHVVIAWNSFS